MIKNTKLKDIIKLNEKIYMVLEIKPTQLKVATLSNNFPAFEYFSDRYLTYNKAEIITKETHPEYFL